MSMSQYNEHGSKGAWLNRMSRAQHNEHGSVEGAWLKEHGPGSCLRGMAQQEHVSEEHGSEGACPSGSIALKTARTARSRVWLHQGSQKG